MDGRVGSRFAETPSLLATSAITSGPFFRPRPFAFVTRSVKTELSESQRAFSKLMGP
jgi:hypothetical protein